MGPGYEPMEPTEAGRPVPSRYPTVQPVPAPPIPAQFSAPQQTGQFSAAQQTGQFAAAQPTGQFGPPTSSVPVSGWPPAQPPRRSPLAVALIALLALVVVGQGVFLGFLQHRLNQANQRAAADRAAAGRRLDSLDARLKALEKQSLDPAGVSSAVLPSVFLIDAVQSLGTAFAIGKSPADGGTDLVTAFHVVAELYSGGGRKVALTHDNERFTAEITRVDQDQDVALLHSTEKFPRLAVASRQVPTGTPIVVVGAPLGLSQSVTTGVVSAVRNDVPGEEGRTFIQFSAPINPGNSGGPVVNAQKQVVGIATQKAPDAEGIGLAVPIEVACKSFSVC
jgi:putative serine protease PepD